MMARREPDFFGDRELNLIYVARKLKEALQLEKLLTDAGLDYLVEPDVFHDFFGHVPLLTIPAFARFMQAYGEAGPKALAVPGALNMLARLYWYMVEFGLIRTAAGLRVYGAGILSSRGESLYALESPKPPRIAFDLRRVMRTRYRIDAFQSAYFVIDRFEDLLRETLETDFAPLYRALEGEADIAPGEIIPEDRLVPSLEGQP